MDINYTDLAVSVFYERLTRGNFESSISYASLYKYGKNAVAILKEKGINDIYINTQREVTCNALYEERELFEERNGGIVAKKSLPDMKNDLLRHYLRLPFNVVEVLSREEILKPIL